MRKTGSGKWDRIEEEQEDLLTELIIAVRDGDLERGEGLAEKLGSTGVSEAPDWDPMGRTAGHVAAWRGMDEMMGMLIRAGWRLGSVDALGRSAAHWAAEHGKVRCLSVLLEAGEDPRAEDSAGFSPARLAAGSSLAARDSERADCVRELLRWGWDPNQRGEDGKTAGIAAIESGRPEVLEALLDGGWDFRRKDGSGRDAEALAREIRSKRCEAILKERRVAREERDILSRAARFANRDMRGRSAL